MTGTQLATLAEEINGGAYLLDIATSLCDMGLQAVSLRVDAAWLEAVMQSIGQLTVGGLYIVGALVFLSGLARGFTSAASALTAPPANVQLVPSKRLQGAVSGAFWCRDMERSKKGVR
jgi:hypothetical protein